MSLSDDIVNIPEVANGLANRGLRSKTVLAIVGLLIASLISIFLAVYSTSSTYESYIYFPLKYDYQVILVIAEMLGTLTAFWFGIVIYSSKNGFYRFKVHKETGSDGYPHILFEPIRDPHLLKSIKAIFIDALPFSLPALIPGSVVYFLNSLVSGKNYIILIGVFLIISVSLLVLLSIKKQMTDDKKGRQREVYRISSELRDILEKLEKGNEVTIVLAEQW